MVERPERFEIRLSADEADALRKLALDAGLSGSDYLRHLLRRTWKERMKDIEAKLEHCAVVSLHDITSRANVTCAVAFLAAERQDEFPADVPQSVGPEPVASNVTRLPKTGVVTVLGFGRELLEVERNLVEARFPGRAPIWTSRSG